MFSSEAGKVCGNDPKMIQYMRDAISTSRVIISVGWSIYSLGDFFGYLTIVLRLPLRTVATSSYAGEAKF